MTCCESQRFAICRYSKVLERCLKSIQQSTQSHNGLLLKVLAYELLVAKRKLVGGGAATAFIKGNADKLRTAFDEAVKVEGLVPNETENSNNDAVNIPRYARVNTLVATVQDTVEALVADGFRLVGFDEVIQAAFSAANPTPRIFARDITLDDVLLFPHSLDLHDHPLVLGAQLRLQDKASCFPAHVLLGGGHGERVRTALDACSAPGNKTTHLAALMRGRGRVLAVERDPARAEMLRGTVAALRAGNVRVHAADFLSVDPAAPPFCDAEAVLLDPSCSGSGIVGHDAGGRGGGAAAGRREEERRLERLSRFQERALLHALSFPRARRVVYSTCSVHVRENEVGRPPRALRLTRVPVRGASRAGTALPGCAAPGSETAPPSGCRHAP